MTLPMPIDQFAALPLAEKLRIPISDLDSTDRLLLVAATIEAHPDHHKQDDWFVGADLKDVVHRTEAVLTACGTTCCAGGWALAYFDQEPYEFYDFESNARVAFGIDYQLSQALFYWMPGRRGYNETASVAAALRAIAAVPPEQRTRITFSHLDNYGVPA